MIVSRILNQPLLLHYPTRFLDLINYTPPLISVYNTELTYAEMTFLKTLSSIITTF